MEFLFQYRVMNRQAWRKQVASDTLSMRSALNGFDHTRDSVSSLLIILAPLIQVIDDFLDLYVPYRTMDVYTVQRDFSELTLTNHGDYRILKFEAENPEWKPGLEEPEEVVLSARANTNFQL